MKINNRKSIKLDKYEREIEASFEKGEFVRIEKSEKSNRIFMEAAKNTLDLQKTKRITLRVKNSDLLKVKIKAQRFQIPYQRLINALIHQYAEGMTKIIL